MTEVPHDQCSAPGCFKHDITYNAHNEQIQALIQLSDTCSQSIDFGCFLAPLQYEETSFGWWLDKSGNLIFSSIICILTVVQLFCRQGTKVL